jgi:hypothetical protein
MSQDVNKFETIKFVKGSFCFELPSCEERATNNANFQWRSQTFRFGGGSGIPVGRTPRKFLNLDFQKFANLPFRCEIVA